MERIYGQCVATLLGALIIFCIFASVFDALFEKNYSSIGGYGSRGDMYVAP
jgi:hypothetical protein